MTGSHQKCTESTIAPEKLRQDIQELEANASAFMDRLSEDPDHVKAYFDHPSLVEYKLS